MVESIDILCLKQQCRVNTALLRRALVFGFSSGDTDRAFEKALDSAIAPESSFKPENFQADLFLQDFVTQCLAGAGASSRAALNQAYLRRLLAHPPRALADTEARQKTVASLTLKTELRTALIQLHRALKEMRELLSAADFSTRIDPNQRRIDILRGYRAAIELMSSGFSEAGPLLARIHHFGVSVASSDGFQSLLEFLAFERATTTIDVRVHLGLDGMVRDFEVLQHAEHEHPVLHRPWYVRLFRNLGLMFRGAHLSEQELLSRILFGHFESQRENFLPLFQLIGDIEFYQAALNFGDLCQQRGASVCFPEFAENALAKATETCIITELRNPFLLLDTADVRPAGVSLQRDAIVILTGPNSGGKTRLMQSVAYVQLLGQCGFPVAAASARIMFTGGLFVSMLEDVRADQREGRLGMELLRIRRLFEQVRPLDLVVIDELCSGTNPSEGEEIFELVLQLLAELGPQVWVSTHFLRLAQALQLSGGPTKLEFLCVKLDQEEKPLFEFQPGVAYTSLAKQTAARLGVTREELMRLVKRAKHES